MFRTGFFESEITPSLGSIIPGDFAARYSQSIRDPLHVRAVVIELDGKTVGLAAVDACGITADTAEKIRERAVKYTPLTHDSIMVMATHCHGGGPTLNWGEEVVRDENYLDFLARRAADALTTAWQRRTDSVLTSGTSELYGYSFVRDYRMKDGTFKTNPGVGNPNIDAPLAEIDPEVRVLTAKDENGRPFGAIVNFALHPAIVADTTISADYIGALAAAMKETYGPDFVTVFINGACGNINHVNPFDPASRRPGIHIDTGRALAEKVREAMGCAENLPETLGFAYSETSIIRRKPDAAYLAWANSVYEALGEHPEKSKPRTAGYVETFFAWQAFKLKADREPVKVLPVQLLSIGGVDIFGCPCQIFVKYGNDLKAASKGAMVSAFANDYGGYVPTPDCMVPGIYEARLASTSQLEPDAGDKLVAALLALRQ